MVHKNIRSVLQKESYTLYQVEQTAAVSASSARNVSIFQLIVKKKIKDLKKKKSIHTQGKLSGQQ